MDGGEHVNELAHTLAKEVELGEDLHLVEVELLALGLGQQPVARQPVLLLVLLVQLQTELQVLDQARLVLQNARAAGSQHAHATSAWQQ